MQIEYSTHFLANGLKIIVHEDHGVAKAVVDVLYKVGARDEDSARTGFAHLFEHLMFSGSPNAPEYDQHVQRIGGENNAFTTNDITNYYISCPANQIETAFWLEADRMLSLDFKQDKLDVQKSVVCEEFKQRYLNQPYGDSALLLRPLCYKTHPYQWNTIGKELSHIEDATLDDVREFFFRHYAPNNATLIVAGDVETAHVLDLAEKWFGDIPRRAVAPKDYPVEPQQTEARSLTVHKPVPQAVVYKAYHIPARADAAFYAADLVTDVLSGGKSSRLYQTLVKQKQIVTSINAYTSWLLDPGLLMIEARLSEGHSPEQYEAALAEIIGEMSNIPEKELEKAKNTIESALVFNLTTIMNRAVSFAFYDAFDQPELINDLNDRYQAPTPQDVQNAAALYLRPENCSTLYYLPDVH